MAIKILIVEDDLSFAKSVSTLLKKNGLVPTVAASPTEALKIYKDQKFDFELLMIDYHFHETNITGADFAEMIKKLNPLQSFVFMSGVNDVEALKTMLKVGASRQYVEKGNDVTEILDTVKIALSDLGLPKPTEMAESYEDEDRRETDIRRFGMVGRSKSLHAIVKQIENYRNFRSRFLIIGATGSGKELLAKGFQIPGKPFYAVDCARFMHGQEQFLESELYGHKKGAFTGADQDKRGAFEIANGGVVFLDELHCLSVVAQSKLLRTLQEMKLRRLGDTSLNEIPFEVTVVAAAKPELLKMVESGEFKEDLYYRLAKAELHILPLSERIEDIKPLAQHFVEKYSRKHNLAKVLHPQTIREFEKYKWPGNVRELESVIENFLMDSKMDVIGPEQFHTYVNKQISLSPSNTVKVNENLNLLVGAVECDHIIEALKKSRFIGAAADSLGIPRTTLNDKIKKFKINPYAYLASEK